VPSKGIRVRVWCEDSEHEAFARCLLADVFGIERRAIDVNKAPDGEGAASNWVVRRYQEEVLPTYRRARHQVGLGFLVLVDGDNVGFKARLEKLKADERAPDDRVVLLAPTWSVETWVLWLDGEPVKEGESTKDRLSPAEFRTRLKGAIARWKTPSQREELPSLANARIELKRLPTEPRA
jgi:hypothetical protein